MALRVTTLSRLALLLELARGPQHGYKLMKAVERQTGTPCSPAQIYPFLSQLEKQGYIKKGSTGARERQAYALTPSGRQFVSAVAQKFGQIMALALADKVHQCAHCSCKIYGDAFWAKSEGLRLPYCCPHCAKDAGAKA